MRISTLRSIFWMLACNILCRLASGSCIIIMSEITAVRFPSGCRETSRSLTLASFVGVESEGGGEKGVEGAREYDFAFVTVELETDAFREDDERYSVLSCEGRFQ